MDGQTVLQGVLLVRSSIDAVRSLLTLVPKKEKRDEIPVYRLVTRDELLLARSEAATDVTGMPRPR